MNLLRTFFNPAKLISFFSPSLDGGIGESMLLGAALSAGTGLLSGRGINPLSMLTGAATGALGGYLFNGGPASTIATEGTPAADMTMRVLENQTPATLSSGMAGGELGMANAFNPITGAPIANGAASQFVSPFNTSGVFGGGNLASGVTAATPAAQGIAGIPTSPFGTAEYAGAVAPSYTPAGIQSVAPSTVSAPTAAVPQAGQAYMGSPNFGTAGNYGTTSTGAEANLGQTGGVAQQVPQPMQDAVKNAQDEYATTGSQMSFDKLKNAAYDVEAWVKAHPLLSGAGAIGAMALMQPSYKAPNIPQATGPKFGLAANYAATPNPTPVYPHFAEGGIAMLAGGGDPINFMGDDMYPQSQQQRSFYATPTQMPTSAQQAMASYEPKTNPLTGQPTAHMATGGIANLGGYSDGGQLLKGPGDGMSDNIPASIGAKQPARLADGEFVVPADVVSHLGNGSTDAGAKQLYNMMNKVRKARTGRTKQGKQINPNHYMPA